MSEHAPPKACPGSGPGREAVWRQEHAPGGIIPGIRNPLNFTIMNECNFNTCCQAPRGNSLSVEQILHRRHGQKKAVGVILKLDSMSSWLILSEANTFIWPGYDLRLIPSSKQNYTYGYLPPKLFELIKTKLLALAKSRHSPAISRD